MADEVGFEPTVGCPTSVFKTGALDRSTTHPQKLFIAFFYSQVFLFLIPKLLV